MRKGMIKKKPIKYIMLVCLVLWIGLISLLLDSFFEENRNANQNMNTEEFILSQLEPGEVFKKGSYITVSDVKIIYDGESFLIENNNDYRVIVTCGVYGKKQNGAYEFIGMPAFYGVDEVQYKKEKQENGWAIEKPTNEVNANSKLIAIPCFFDFGDDFADWDIDNDGYYDIAFTISPQKSENEIITSTNNSKSSCYRLRAEK